MISFIFIKNIFTNKATVKNNFLIYASILSDYLLKKSYHLNHQLIFQLLLKQFVRLYFFSHSVSIVRTKNLPIF